MAWWKDKKYLISFAALAVGFLFIMLLKAQGLAGSTPQDVTMPNLISIEQENQQLAADNEKLRQEVAKYTQGTNATVLARQQLQDNQKSAGLVAMRGPGLRITLNDAERKGTIEDPQNYVIHEAYIRLLINILWNGGAEAIAVNGQRTMSYTEVFCSGTFIQINGTRQMPPYVIEAIGDTHNLQSALKFAYTWDQLGDFQQQYGITRTMEVVNDLYLPAGVLRKYQYVEPVKEGT